MHRGDRWIALALAGLSIAAADPVRVAVVIGNDQGAESDLPLRYAARDAERIERLLTSLGGVSRSWLVTGGADEVQVALREARLFVERERTPVTLFVYYSGHADEHFLRLGGGRMTLEGFQTELKAIGADLTVLVVDACRNRAGSAPKGVQLAPPIEVEVERPQGPRGWIVIRSVRAGEIALESDALGGSVFTHHFISSLEGAGDADGDRRVTLSEAYAETRRKTMATALAQIGQPQVPSFELDLNGEEDLVLTDLRRAEADLIFPGELAGHYFVAERSYGSVVSELSKVPQRIERLALPRGEYAVFTREGDQVAVAEISLPWGGERVLEPSDFTRYPQSRVIGKGGRLILESTTVSARFELDSGFIDGLAWMPLVRIAVARPIAGLEWHLGAVASYGTLAARDIGIETIAAGGAFGASYPIPFEWLTFATELELRPIWLRQTVAGSAPRDSFVGQLRLGEQLRLGLPASLRLAIGGGVELSAYQSADFRLRPSVYLSAGVELGL